MRQRINNPHRALLLVTLVTDCWYVLLSREERERQGKGYLAGMKAATTGRKSKSWLEQEQSKS